MNTTPPYNIQLPPVSAETLEQLSRLIGIVARLRDPNGGCPWDLAQTHKTLTQYLIEEAYEVVEAIEEDRSDLPKELGDVLLQVILHSQIASEAGSFSLADVARLIGDKLISRHPHVFGTTSVSGADEVLKNWERNKRKEQSAGVSILDNVPRSLPALQRADRCGDKAHRVGFDWKDASSVLAKIQEEIQELDKAETPERREAEFGDLLFSLVQYARKSGLQSERALHTSCGSFIRRFSWMEANSEQPLESLTDDEREALWHKAKQVHP